MREAMKKQFARAALAAALLCSSAGAAMMISAAPAYAADKPHVSRSVGEALNDAIKAINGGDFKTAADKVKEARSGDDLTDYDKLKINQVAGFLAIKQKDYASAATAFENVAASPAFSDLPKPEQASTLHNAMILSAQEKHWPQVIAVAKKIEKTTPLDAKTNTIVAQAYYLTNDYPDAKTYAQKAIDAATAKGAVPEKAAYQILMSAQVKNKNQAGAIKTLEQIALHYGTASDWGQLIDMAMSAKGLDELDALYYYRLRFLAGATAAADDYRIAAGIAMHQGYPTEAEAILNKGLAAGKLSDSGKTHALLRKARHEAASDKRSLPAFAKMAARSKYGLQDIKLAEDYWGYGRYQDAIAAAKAGIAKGHLKDPSEGDYILGISQVAAGQYKDAVATLAKVDGKAARARGAYLWSLYAKSKMTPSAAPATAAAPAPAQQ
jgi:hypothetical protein